MGQSWRLRSVPEDLRQRYRAEGWWDDGTLGTMVADGLGRRGAIGVTVDVTDRPMVDAGVAQVLDRLGPPTVLVNNAGLDYFGAFLKVTLDDWNRVLEVNLTGMFHCCQAVVPHMLDAGWGRIVNISSVIGEMGNLGQANYASSKAGMLGLTKSAALELARYGITVNAICPGFIETDMLGTVPEEIRKQILTKIPLGRFGSPQDVAQAVRYLVCDAPWMTGSTFDLNGGQYM